MRPSKEDLVTTKRMSADKELFDITKAMKNKTTPPKPITFKYPTLVDLQARPKDRKYPDLMDSDDFADDAFKHFRYVEVEYSDPTLEALCGWATEEGNKEVTEMLQSYREWILLGRHAEKMMIAFADSQIHAYDNTMTNYPGRSADQGRYKHGRQDVANRITHLRQTDNEAQTPCNVTLYEDCHRLHVTTSQLHECSKCCIRYKKKILKKTVSCIPSSLDMENRNVQPTGDGQKHILLRVCRFRAPWLERMCKFCSGENKSVRWDICEKCFKEGVKQTGLELNVPYRPQFRTEVKYS